MMEAERKRDRGTVRHASSTYLDSADLGGTRVLHCLFSWNASSAEVFATFIATLEMWYPVFIALEDVHNTGENPERFWLVIIINSALCFNFLPLLLAAVHGLGPTG
ncbi:hypothetical protein BDV98DRAFT_566329 [Pterulicium gracile]|uniref:Uncharacterized protein n=1 Tax=Pterulicium gracile TaxID=1884261 RepID=A0A5C3QQD7_9AGAR|nr:hypothetical protein BDV98DRAFT_566329 [Pterula gracilis]